MSIAVPAPADRRANPLTRHLGHRPPRAAPHAPPARGAGRRDDPADHVRAAVRVRVRRRDPGADGGSYREFLMGGIFAQTIVFGAFGVAITLANDRTNGAIDRFRSLPIAQRRGARRPRRREPAASMLPIILMSICGLIVGWRIHSGVARRGRRLRADARPSRSRSSGSACCSAACCRRPEAVQGVAFVGDLPAHVHRQHVRAGGDAAGRPARRSRSGTRSRRWRRRCASCSATRGASSARTRPGRCSTPSPTRWIWIVGIVLVCAPIAIRAYRRTTSD